jgi:glutamine synthetase
VRFDSGGNTSFYEVDSIEGSWNTGRDEEGGNKGYKPRTKGGYFPVPPMDHYTDLRSEMVHNLEAFGIQTQLHHHEVGSGGQGEIGIEFDTLAKIADKLMTFKYVVKNTGARRGQDRHLHAQADLRRQRLGDAHPPVAVEGRRAAVLRRVRLRPALGHARWYIGGLLAHAKSVLAFTNPTTNSYRRLVPGYEAPVNLVYSARNRSAAVRIPISGDSPKAKRIEFRVPDPSSNPYLAFAAMMMAGLDGIRNKIEPPDPVDKDIYDLPPEELLNLPSVPGRSRRRCGVSPRTTSSCSRAGSSPRTSSRPGSSTRWTPRSRRSPCVPTRTSSRCTTTSEVPRAAKTSHDRTCTVSRTIEAGTPVTVHIDDGT